MTPRLLLLAALIGAVMLGLACRLAWLQVVEGDRLAAAVDQSRLLTEIIPPRRGRILDRTGAAIAENRSLYHLAMALVDLELTGRVRRDIPIWRLDQARFDALVSDVAVRLPRTPPAQVRDTLLNELTAFPGTGLRTGPRSRDRNLALVAVPRQGLRPVTDATADDDTAELIASDLLSDDPREALERELSARWQSEITLATAAEFRSAMTRLDRELNLDPSQHCTPVLEPFMPGFQLVLPAELGGFTLDLHLIDAERRTQAETVLATLAGEAPQLIHERLDRALAATRALTPAPASGLYYGPSARADGIAPLLPPGIGLHETALSGVPGMRERILLLQGDAPESDGLFGLAMRRLGASLGTDPDVIDALVRKHAERIRPATCERDYRVHHIVFDPVRYERLVTGLAAVLTTLGRPTTRLEIEHALADVRTTCDRAWTGQTHLDALPLIRDIPHAMAVRLTAITGTPPSALRKQYDDTDDPLPGISVTVDLGRGHPFPGSASHLIGTIARGADPERGGLITWTGTSGLEQRYDALLRGLPGATTRARTPEGIVVLKHTEAEAGADLHTELDMEVQTAAEDALAHWYELAEKLGTANPKMDAARSVGQGRAGFVLMDCKTGALLACASAPGFNLDDLRTDYEKLLHAPGSPLRNWATEAEQPPGSSMKICTALAGLEFGVLNPGEFIHSQGYMAMQAGKKILRDHAPPGDYDLPTAVQVSSNIYFATVAERINKGNPGRLSEFALRFGLGQANAIDVPGQRTQPIPTPQTLPRLRPSEPKWRTSDSWRLGIGQFLTASPLQVVCIAAAVANGGHIVRPYLVKPAGQPEVKDLHISEAWLAELRRGMELVTENLPHSTARYLVLDGAAAGIKVAAKTGTSEWGSEASRLSGRTPDHAWLIGYAPADDPVVAFSCFIYCGTSGGQATSGVVKRVLETYFTKYGRAGHAQGTPPDDPH
jgi:penicillin-binding protein 2